MSASSPSLWATSISHAPILGLAASMEDLTPHLDFMVRWGSPAGGEARPIWTRSTRTRRFTKSLLYATTVDPCESLIELGGKLEGARRDSLACAHRYIHVLNRTRSRACYYFIPYLPRRGGAKCRLPRTGPRLVCYSPRPQQAYDIALLIKHSRTCPEDVSLIPSECKASTRSPNRLTCAEPISVSPAVFCKRPLQSCATFPRNNGRDFELISPLPPPPPAFLSTRFERDPHTQTVVLWSDPRGRGEGWFLSTSTHPAHFVHATGRERILSTGVSSMGGPGLEARICDFSTALLNAY